MSGFPTRKWNCEILKKSRFQTTSFLIAPPQIGGGNWREARSDASREHGSKIHAVSSRSGGRIKKVELLDILKSLEKKFQKELASNQNQDNSSKDFHLGAEHAA